MKRYWLFFINIFFLLIAAGCHDEDFGYTEQDVFTGLYKRNFEKEFGKISPDETWDFSHDASFARNMAATRAMNADGIDLDDEGYYRVQKTTLDWINDNISSKAASSFVFKYNNESLTFIPISIAAGQTTPWQLKTRMFSPKGNNESCTQTDQTCWQRNDSKVQITNACQTCGGSGSVPAACHTCSGSGHVSHTIDCRECNGKGSTTCFLCRGRGTFLWIIPCFLCGRDGKFECNRCNETGKVSEEINCTSCSGSGVSGTTTCTACNGTGGELHWSPEPNAKGTSEAVAVRAKTMKLNLSGIGTGDIFYPYLKNNITYNTSIDQKVKFFAVPRPTNIREDKFTYVLAFETSSNNDYKDIIFLVVSDKRFESVPTNPLFTSIRKRYLIEDLCSSSDFDFNDIVVDVEQIKAYERTGNNGNYGFKSNTTQTATLKHVCGTVPFEVYIGSKKLFAVTDPTDKQKMAQELNCSVTDAAVDGFDLDAVAEDIKTWNPANNNIRIKVWKNSQPGAESYEGAEFVNSSFPQQGTVPFIIATDVSVAWTAKDGDRFDINKLK